MWQNFQYLDSTILASPCRISLLPLGTCKIGLSDPENPQDTVSIRYQFIATFLHISTAILARHVGFRNWHSEHVKSVLTTPKTTEIPFRSAINRLHRFYTFRPPSWPAMLDFVIASRNMYNRSQRPRKPSSYHSDPLSSDCNDFTNFDRHLSPAMLDY